MAITTSIIGKVRYNVRGEYNTSSSYTVDDIVTYVGSQYLCKTANSSGSQVPGVASSAIWEKLSGLTRERGEWNSGTAYQLNDIVTVYPEYAYNSIWKYYDTYTYICKQANTNYNPLTNDGTQWALLSEGGMYRKNAFLAGMNEGYTPPYKPLWNARSQSVIGTINTVFYNTAGSLIRETNTVNGRTGSPSTAMLRLTASGGGGSGFVGVAHVNAATLAVFQCDIIDPGSGYTSTPTISVDTTVTGYTGVYGGGALPTFGCNVTTNSTDGATGRTVLVGMGDSIGPAKAYGTHQCRYNMRYVNRRHQFVNIGESVYTSGGTSTDGQSPTDNMLAMAQFVNLDYLDGVLPTPDGEYPKVIQVESGGYNTLVLFNNGEVHYMGYNGNGNSGGNYTNNFTQQPVRCGYFNINISGTTALRGKRAIRIAAASGGDNNESHAMYALIENPTDGSREIWSWGYNGYGQLGLNDTTNRQVPTQITFSAGVYGRVVSIWATGGNYGQLYVLTDLGHLYACGYNGYGQIGNGNTTNQSVLVRVDANDIGTLTGTNGRVRKFSINGGGSHGTCALLKGNGTVFTWGYNGYGGLGHNHTFNTYVPVQVRTSGYSGASNPVSTSGNKGTGQGTAFTDCIDVWQLGGNSHMFMYLTRGSSIINNTLYSCGYNGYYNLSISQNSTTNQSTLQNVQINNGSNATNVMSVTSNQGHSSSHIQVAIYRYDSTFAARAKNNLGQWFHGGFDNGVSGNCQNDSYNARGDQDPNRIDANFRLKNNMYEPYAAWGNWFYDVSGTSASKNGFYADLRTGQVFGTQNGNTGNNGYCGGLVSQGGRGNINHIRYTHM
jgi:alpha-tubulin suppressor-like RCC1 family protein